MNNYTSAKRGQKKSKQLVAEILLVSWLVLGSAGIGVASETPSLLQFQGDRITGVLKHVPLRTVLEQFREKLAIEYVVPMEELDKPVSAFLADESESKALAKILASWDYALQVNHEGRVHQIFVVAKNGTIENEKNPVKTSESKMEIFPRKKNRSKPILTQSKTQILLSRTKMTSNPNSDDVASPMFTGSSEKLGPIVTKSSQEGPMSIQPSSNFMQVIPASGYPPMEILPVSEEARRDFMQIHN